VTDAPVEIRRLDRADMPALAGFYRGIFDRTYPAMAGRHTPAEDRAYFEQHVFATSALWAACRDTEWLGFLGLAPGWVEKLYVAGAHQGRGIGGLLLDFAKSGSNELHLWTYARNRHARGFYEANGFSMVEETDGSDNEDREPDVLYRWRRRN